VINGRVVLGDSSVAPPNGKSEAALRAYCEADFALCAEVLSGNRSLPAVALRARALERYGRPAEALSTLSAIDLNEASHASAAELLALRASAFSMLNDARAEATLVEARVRADSSNCAAAECEVEYVSARLSWMEGRVVEAMVGVERVLAFGMGPSWGEPLLAEPWRMAAYWRARAHELRGVCEALREDYAAQASSLIAAFEEFDTGGVVDLRVEASMLLNLAVLARDVASPEIAEFVEDRAAAVAWNKNSASFEFEVFRALGWCQARYGDQLGAFRHLRRSAQVAPSAALRIRAIVDRSFLANELGESAGASEDLKHAIQLANHSNWEELNGSERSGLYTLAARVAPIDPDQARRLINRYFAIKSPVSPKKIFRRDRRQRADECSAHAAVLVAEGERERATSLLLESFQIWSEVGYAWRAATVAADLAELTGETRFFEVAAREAAKQPHSWLARRIAALETSRSAP